MLRSKTIEIEIRLNGGGKKTDMYSTCSCSRTKAIVILYRKIINTEFKRENVSVNERLSNVPLDKNEPRFMFLKQLNTLNL